jgi:hypothetical protein
MKIGFAAHGMLSLLAFIAFVVLAVLAWQDQKVGRMVLPVSAPCSPGRF